MTVRPSLLLAGLAATVVAWGPAGPLAALGAGVAAAVVAVLADALAERRAAAALGDVERMLRAWQGGDFTSRLRWARADSVGRVADTANDTGRALAAARAEEESLRNRQEAMLAALDAGVVYVSENRRIVAMNAAAEILFDTHQADAIGRSLLEVVGDPELDRLAEEALTQGRTASAEFDPGPGDQRVMRYRLAPTRSESGRVTGLLVVASDLTHERRLERVRQDFIENVTHELQTPLTSIRGFAETLAGETGADPDRRRRYLAIVEREAERLSRLVSDLLDLSRWEGKRPPLNATAFDAASVIHDVEALYRPLIERSGLGFRLELPEGPLPLLADREAFARILRNLLDNARKYTREGSITLRLFRTGRAYRIEIEDTGMGIPASAIPRVFERFYRVDKGRDRESGGTGLGLAIVRHLAEAHGGHVRARSDGLGLGSRFSVDWPIEPGRTVSAVAKSLGQDEQAGERQEAASQALGAVAGAAAEPRAEGEAGAAQAEAGGGDGREGEQDRGAENGQGKTDRERVEADRDGGGYEGDA